MPRLESPSLCHWRSRRKKKTNIFLKETWIIGHVSEAIKVWCRNQLFKLIWAESSVELFWSIFQLMLSKPFARWTYTIQSTEFYQRGPKRWLNDRTMTFSDILVIFQSTFSCWMAEVHNVIDCIRENTLCKASKCRGIYNLTRRKMVNISSNFLLTLLEKKKYLTITKSVANKVFKLHRNNFLLKSDLNFNSMN